MAQRLNKKLLLGLGSTVGFLTTGTLGGFGINVLVKHNELAMLKQQINSLAEANFEQATDYNVAQANMFFDTTNLKSFHFGNTQKGQTLTPWGWLGVYEESGNVAKKIALTAWNGQILWVNNDYENESGLDYNVYEIKYDWNTNLIFVLRTASNNGLLNNDNANLPPVRLDVLDALTGIKQDSIESADFGGYQRSAWGFLSGKFLDWNQTSHRERSKNLYYLDVSSKPGTNEVAVTWMPNFMQIVLRQDSTQTIGDNSKNYLPPFVDIFDGWKDVAKTFIFTKNGTNVVHNTRSFNLRDSREVTRFGGNPNWFAGTELLQLNNFHLLANPFITITKDNHFQLHFFVADKDGSKIFHKWIAFQKNGSVVPGDWDSTEIISGNGKFSFFNDRTWANAVGWNNGFINANLRVNRNMFDDNSVVFAYPFAAGGNPRVPIFNVAQILINSNDFGKIIWSGGGQKQSTIFNLAREILDYWAANKNNYGANNVNKIYPFPDPGHTNINHNYNRLIGVSPFDNTFLYASKPNLTDAIFDQSDNNANKWASFWIINRWSNNTPYRPFVIANDAAIGKMQVDPYMTSVNDLYENGLTFDLRSFINGANQKSLNLYFNQKGSGKNDRYNNNGFLTSKIGLLDDVINRANSSAQQNKLWVGNIARPTTLTSGDNPFNLVATGITKDAYASLIYSRANLEKWYAKTQFNNTNPANNLPADKILSANDSDARAEATNFNNSLSGSLFNNNEAIDLVSAWLDNAANGNKKPPNWNRRIALRPIIKVENRSEQFALPLEITYPLKNLNEIQNKPDWSIKTNVENLTFKQNQNIANASYEILTTFGRTNNNIVLSAINEATDNLGLAYENPNPAWFDIRKNGAANFGALNNNVVVNGKTPLRLLVKIVKPTGNLPAWFNQIDQQIFTTAYPVDNVAPGETAFQTVLNQLAQQKATYLEIQNSNGLAIGLANLKLEAFLGPNPTFATDNSNNKIYTNGSSKMIVDATTGQRIIYNDRFNDSRTFYDQSQTSYGTFNGGGFNASLINTNLWKNGLPTNGQKLRVSADYSLLPDKLVRKDANNRDPLFKFDYQTGTQNLEIIPIDVAWFKNQVTNFNRMVNLYLGLQYKTATNDTWQDYVVQADNQVSGGQRKFFYDSEITFNAENKLIINNFPARDVTKLRLKLWRKDDNEVQQDQNHFVKYQNFTSNTDNTNDNPTPLDKFISVAHNIASQKVLVDKAWFEQVNLTNQSNSLAQISVSDLLNFEQQIFAKSTTLQQNQALKQKVKLMYKWANENQTYDAAGLVALIQARLNAWSASDQGVFALWNGTNGLKISAVFSTVDDTVVFVTPNNQNPNESDLTGIVQSTIKTEINLQTYLQELQAGRISAAQGANPGQIQPNSISFPAKNGAPGSAQFAGKSFSEIEQILNNVGIRMQYKKWQNNGWSNWLNNINDVDSFNPSQPQMILGFTTDPTWNVKLKNGSQELDNNAEITLNLALPKLVKLPNQQAISTMIASFNQTNVFSGNTYELQVKNLTNGKNIIVNALIAASTTNANDYADLNNNDTFVVLKFQLGNSQWFEAAALQSYLKGQTSDQPNNALKLKIELSQAAQDQFVLENALANYQFELLNDNNTTIKKWIHGSTYEQALGTANSIAVEGNKNALRFNFPTALNAFAAEATFPPGLALAYQLNSTGPWNYGTLPTQVNPDVKTIAVKISARKPGQTPAGVYLYGPEEQNNQAIQTIDLSKVTTLVRIDPSLFSQNPISSKVLNHVDQLTTDIIKKWENEQIWNNIADATDPTIRTKLIIKYKFLDQTNLTAQNLPQTLTNALNDYANPLHHGIVKLYDPDEKTPNGIKIIASFEKVDPNDTTVQLIDQTGNVVDGNDEASYKKRSGIVNTKNVHTTLNFQAWWNNLRQTPTDVTTTAPGQIDVLTPPTLAGAAASNLFAGQIFSDVEDWLKQAQIDLVWSNQATNQTVWQPTNLIKTYDPQLGKLWFAIDNKSTNLILQIGANDLITPQSNSRQQSLEIELNAPKVIRIENTDLDGIGTAFSGNTKFLDLDHAAIKTKIDAILNRQGFNNAPLSVKFQIGDAPFYDYKNLKTELSKQTNDLVSAAVKAQIYLPDNQNNWQLSNGQNSYEIEIFNANNSPLKIYINDQNIFADLKNTVLSGSNKNLQFQWPQGFTVNPNDGILTINPLRGKGLRLEFSFADLAQDATTIGTDWQNQWVNKLPTTFNLTNQKVYIRLQVVDANKYVYEKIEQTNPEYKFALDLTNLQQVIGLDSAWLNQILVQQNKPIEQLSEADFGNYEQLVYKNAAQNGIDTSLHSKFKIVYRFNGQTNLDKQQLMNAISNFKQQNPNQNLGILQLWNNAAGQKIETQFVDADPADNYLLEISGNNQQVLDTSKISTTIDFTKVIAWTKTIKVEITPKPNQANGIQSLIFPEISAVGDNYFDQQTWNDVERTLKNLGIIIQYRSKLTANPTNNWIDDQSGVDQYEPTIGQFQIRFRFDAAKAQNIFFKIEPNANPLPGNQSTPTQAFDLNLKIQLALTLNNQLVNEFINTQDVIGGNTKNIIINEAAQDLMVQKIKDENAVNNTQFNNAPLIVQYYLGNSTTNIPENQWRNLNDFKNYLAQQNNDQNSNKIVFRLIINPAAANAADFSIANNQATLHEGQPGQEAQWKVKFYINSANWEANAAQVSLSGTNNHLNWNFASFGANNIIEEVVGNNKKIFFKNATNTKALQMQFSLNPSIDYQNNNVSDDLNQLTNQWVTLKPEQIPATARLLKIRLVPTTGFVYQPAENPVSAKAHEIDLSTLKREILVDPNLLTNPLELANPANFISDLQLGDLNNFVTKVLNPIEAQLQNQVRVKFDFNGQNELDAQGLFNAITGALNNKTAPDYGLLQLWNGQNGKQIKAHYTLADPTANFILIDQTDPNADAGRKMTVTTEHIKTLVDLKAIVKDLTQQQVNVILNNNRRALTPLASLEMPAIPAGSASALQGLSWVEFSTVLNNLGIKIQARPVVATGQPAENWSTIDQVKKYDDTVLKLELRFVVEATAGANIVLSIKTDQDVDATTAQLPTFTMNLNAPARVVIDPALLQTFVNQINLNGTTKVIHRDANAETTLIEAIIQQNSAVNPDIFGKLNGRLQVQYWLGKDSNTNQITWKNWTDFEQDLARAKTDQPTNQIWYRLNILDPDATNNQIFQIDQRPQILLTEQINDQASVKIYINETGFSAAINNLVAAGSTDHFQINGLDQWKASLPKGLNVWYSNVTTPNENDDRDWTQTVPATLNADKKLWLRFKVSPGYVYEHARTDMPQYSQKHEIDTSQIKTIIHLQKAWLNKINLLGNTKEIQINEDLVLAEIQKPGVLPTGQADLVILEYHIKNQPNWMKRADFINYLQSLEGAKDELNFILLREELEIRYSLKAGAKIAKNYGLNIDNIDVNQQNRNDFNVQMVTTQQNQTFRGYINLDKFKHFVKQNFRLEGSNNQPKLKIAKRTEMESMMQNYATNQLFDILISGVKLANGQFDWTKAVSILKQGRFIGEDDLAALGFVLDGNKEVALKFVAKDANYDVYQAQQKFADGYELNISENVKITFEIENPFKKQNKTLALWWTENQNKTQAKYYQGEGGFKVVIGLPDGNVDETNFESALAWLNGINSGLTDKEKSVLELVYHIYDGEPSAAEIARVGSHENITNYDGILWKPLKPVLDSVANDDFTKPLGLKVGQYVSVALRVKAEYATGEDIYTLKDDEHSFLEPITASAKPGRAHGYKVKMDDVNINLASITLENTFVSDYQPLDGYTNIKRLSLDKDEKGNYLGVKLRLNLFHELHLDNHNQAIITPFDKIKLVKRQVGNATITEYFKDASGTEIQDKDGNKIPILLDAQGQPNLPELKTQATVSQLFDYYGEGYFGLSNPINQIDKDKWGIFKNETVEVAFEAFEGQGGAIEPDFILDKTKTVDLKEQISPQIKFPILNQDNVKYEFNRLDFAKDQIQFEHANQPDSLDPIDGKSRLKTLLKLTKTTKDNPQGTIIEGTDFTTTVNNLKTELQTTFNNKLGFETIYEKADGGTDVYSDLDLYKLATLKNNDRIKIRIVATDPNFIWAQAPEPLTIHVNGLTAKAPNRDKLKFLRVEQSGTINGKGSFKILINDPQDPNSDPDEILNGWKFVIRVWNDQKAIKINWTDDQSQISKLENNDKVEWKLLDEFGNPVNDAYYNTVAGNHEIDPATGTTKYVFNQMHYPNGLQSGEIVAQEIGKYPKDPNAYPENSGFVISGLKDELEAFEITDEAFAKIMAQLEPHYVGLNGQGTINFKEDYLSQNYYVNANGELYEKPIEEQLAYKQEQEEVAEISLAQFLANTTFYTSDPNLVSYQNGFKFMGNDTNLNNHLRNGDQIWAQFDLQVDNNEINHGISTELNPVNGLKDIVTDPMTPMWYILFAVFGLLTLGGSSLLMLWIRRHRKLKK